MSLAVAANQARDRADRIREGLEDLKPLILAAWEARDWEALGYGSWHEYVVGEFGGPLRLGRTERQAIATDMREKGMSLRAIGSALGMSHEQARADVGVNNLTPDAVVGLDGKTYQPSEREAPESYPAYQQAFRALQAAVKALEEVASEYSVEELAQAIPLTSQERWVRRLRRSGTFLGHIAYTSEEGAERGS